MIFKFFCDKKWNNNVILGVGSHPVYNNSLVCVSENSAFLTSTFQKLIIVPEVRFLLENFHPMWCLYLEVGCGLQMVRSDFKVKVLLSCILCDGN